MKGHIRERSSGHWAIVIDVRDPETGKRRRRWHSYKGTKRAAQIEAARLISELQQGGAVDPSRITLAEFLDRFEATWVSVHVTALTAERYRHALQHVRQYLGGRPLQKVQAGDLAGLYASLVRDGGLAPRTVKLIHRVVHRALGQAKAWGLVRDNVAEGVNPPKAADIETEMLQPEEAAALVERLRGGPLYMIALLGLATGMRRNEMLGLRWCDIDLGAGRITISQSLEQTTSRGIQVKSPKTKSGRRTISLPGHLVAELRAHWIAQQEQRLAIGLGKAPDDAPVLAAPDGSYQSPGAISQAWGRAVPGYKLHSLRHTHASMLIASSMDVLTISRRLGHASATVTLSVYGHLIAGADDRAAQIMDAVFGSKMVASSEGKPLIPR
jgi:integrase